MLLYPGHDEDRGLFLLISGQRFMTHKRFILYSRSYCHLCDDMLKALRELSGEALPIEVVDVDLDAELVERYDELVPVLMGVEEGHAPRQLCNYFLNENNVRAFLDV
jgi:thiol-disulfide isomerase/thioredoxin